MNDAPARLIHVFSPSEQERVQRSMRQRLEWARDHNYSQKTSNGFSDAKAPRAHLLGCAGELAVSLWLRLPWVGEFFDQRGPRPIDIGADIEIKTSDIWYHEKKKRFYSLIVRRTDPVEPRYVRCTLGKNWGVSIDGWLWGPEARLDRYWRLGDPERGPSWYVPIPDLRPMSTFRKEASDDIRNYTPRRPNGRIQYGDLPADAFAYHARAV